MTKPVRHGTRAGRFDVVGLLEELVHIDSRNSRLSPDSPGEGPLAAFVADTMAAHGLRTGIQEVAPGRPNVLVRLDGTPGVPTLVFEAHLDTVPLPPAGIRVRRENGRLYGRGSCDTKGSLAAMMAAMIELADSDVPHSSIILAGTADEEATMMGAAALVDQLPDVLGAVVGEPTSLRPVRAHNGFIRVAVRAEGVTAHSSKAHLGANAVLDASRAVVALADTVGAELAQRGHALIGPALLTPTMIKGGVAPNVVPDSCEVIIDRRLAPGEVVADALAAIRETLAAVKAEGRLWLDEPTVALAGVETDANHPLVRTLSEAVDQVVGEGAQAIGVTYSTDACRLGPAGVDCVIFGPGSIDQAHTDDEWVELAQVEQAVDILARCAQLAVTS